MDKDTLLKEIETKELARLNALTDDQLIAEMLEWFTDVSNTFNRSVFINDYLTDFMQYRHDESVEELKEKLEGYEDTKRVCFECGIEIDLNYSAFYPYSNTDDDGNYTEPDMADVPFCNSCASKITR